jgi:hypothetical protein
MPMNGGYGSKQKGKSSTDKSASTWSGKQSGKNVSQDKYGGARTGTQDLTKGMDYGGSYGDSMSYGDGMKYKNGKGMKYKSGGSYH